MSFFGKITTKEHYGVRLALRLAETYYSENPVSLKQIGEIEDISVKYLEQLIVPFKKAKWIESIRGREGGYLMKKDPNKITLKDVVLMLDEDLSIVDCLRKNPAYKCSQVDSCESKKAWEKVQHALETSMKNIKLSSLVKF